MTPVVKITHGTVKVISVYKKSLSHPEEEMVWSLREDEEKDGYTAPERIEQLAISLIENPKITAVRIAVNDEPMTTIDLNLKLEGEGYAS